MDKNGVEVTSLKWREISSGLLNFSYEVPPNLRLFNLVRNWSNQHFLVRRDPAERSNALDESNFSLSCVRENEAESLAVVVTNLLQIAQFQQSTQQPFDLASNLFIV